MGKRRAYREIASVEEYLSMRQLSAPEKNRIRGDVGDFLSILEGSGRILPSEEDYSTFREMRLQKDSNPRTVQDRIHRIKKYYEWRQTQEMKDIEEISGILNGTTNYMMTKMAARSSKEERT